MGSLRNHDGVAAEDVNQKLNLYFTYESRDTLKSFALCITLKTIAKQNPEHSNKFEIKIKKYNCRGSRSRDNPKFGHFTFSLVVDGKETYRELQRTCTAIVLLVYSFVQGRSRCRCRRGFVNSLITHYASFFFSV